MRARRSAKLAEYLSTYAILEHIGIHPTALIEKRDTAVGIGLHVRDACDAGTTLLAVPSRRFCTNSVLSKIGLKCAFTDPRSSTPCLTSSVEHATLPDTHDLHDGILSFLTGSARWPELAWRLALEQHRSVSHLWGWLQSLPSADEFRDQTEAAERRCRVHHTMLLPYYMKGRQRMQQETALAYRQLRTANVLPSYDAFQWAVEVLLSRGLLLPVAWATDASATHNRDEENVADDRAKVSSGASAASQSHIEEEDAFELGVAPFLDLVNAPDEAGRAANAHIEVASSLEELPTFFKDDVAVACGAKGRDGMVELEAVLRTHYYLCLTLEKPLQASEEVIVAVDTPVLTTGVLQSSEDRLVSRLLKYKY